MERNYPEMCYIYVDSNMQIGIVKWGEYGYYETTYDGKKPENEQLVKKLNSQLGVSYGEAEAMKILSMNKIIEGNNAEWQKKFDEIVNKLEA